MTDKKRMVHVEHLKKSFGHLEVLKDINVDINEGEVVVLLGPSGSGKSTFLRCLNQLEDATGGVIVVDDAVITDKHTDINKARENIGMVFQHFNLFNNKNVLENITMAPIELKLMNKEEATKRALELLKRVGLEEKADAYPSQLSGGQKQRVAIARAMAMDPSIILADEPTGALDSETGRLVMDLFHKLHEEQNKTIILITHSPELAEETQRVITIKDGLITGERKGGAGHDNI